MFTQGNCLISVLSRRNTKAKGLKFKPKIDGKQEDKERMNDETKQGEIEKKAEKKVRETETKSQ